MKIVIEYGFETSMENKMKYLILLVLFAISAISQEQKSLDITIYNDNLGVVKDVREFDLKKGNSIIYLQDIPKLIDANSVKINFDGTILEQNYRYDLADMQKILDKYIDKTITLKNKDEQISGKLISSTGQIVIQKPEGGLVMIPDVSKYNISVDELPAGFITKPTLVWDINANKAGKQNIDVSYHTEGISWEAQYVALLNKDDSKISLNSWVSISNNSGATFQNANLKLMAGEVNRSKKNDFILRGSRGYMANEGGLTQSIQLEEKSFFEYHLYELQRKTTLMNNETKQISLFDANSISVNKKLVYNSYFGENKTNAKVILEFVNSNENNLGKPFPAGVFKINKDDGSSIAFIGEDLIKHTPKDEEISLTIGEAFDVLIEEYSLNTERISDKVTESEYEIILKNRKDTDISIDVIKNLGQFYKLISSDFKPEYKGTEATFKVPVKKNSELKFKLKVRYSYL